MAVLTSGLFALPARAQEESGDPAALPRATLRLRYGIARHSGRQQIDASELQYKDTVYDDLGLSLSAFTDVGWGGLFGLQHEHLSLVSSDTGVQVAHAPLLRFQLGLAARFSVGPVQLQPFLGYALAQLPSVPELTDPRLLRAVRRSALFSLRARLPLPERLTLEARGEAPFAVFAIDGQGRPMTTSGLVLGAALGRSLGRLGSVGSTLFLDYQYVHDSYDAGSDRNGSQSISRIGLSLELGWWQSQSP